MLSSRAIPVVLAAVALLVAAVPVTAAPANECKTMPDADLPNGRLGRPCIQVDLVVSNATGENSCVSVKAARPYLTYDRDPLCTFYFVLVPFADGGQVGSEVDRYVVYAETNDIQGLQTVQGAQVPDTDQAILI